MINIFLGIIMAAFVVCFYEKRLKKEKQIVKAEEENRKVYFEQGDRQAAYKIEIFHHGGMTEHGGKIELNLFSAQIYSSIEEVFEN